MINGLVQLIKTVIYQPLVNIIVSWQNILSGKNNNNLRQKVQPPSSKNDYLNLLQDWERVDQDFWHLFKW